MINVANLFTVARIVLTPFVVLAILNGQYSRAFWLGIAAGITDVLDGLFARTTKHVTRAGAYLDPIADKLLLSASYVALGAAGAVPLWMVGVVFARDIFILAMAGYGYLFTTYRDFPPSVWGKLSTLAQILAALAAVNEKSGSHISMQPFLWIMVVLTIWSGIDYGRRGWTMLRTAPSGARR